MYNTNNISMNVSLSSKLWRYGRQTLVFLLVIVFIALVAFVSWTRSLVTDTTPAGLVTDTKTPEETHITPFPVGINIENKEIVERQDLLPYIEENLEEHIEVASRPSIFDRLLASLVQFDWYQNLASPVSRILVIYPGERKEEVAKNFGGILRWTIEQKKEFMTLVTESDPIFPEGKFFPGHYTVSIGATPEEVATQVNARFESEIISRYSATVAEAVPLKEAMIVASLLEREAYDFEDMRRISGIIWNRLFIDMPLQLDASLQYAKGSRVSESKWWPKVIPQDKYIKSEYNTYANKGLPPEPIANVSVAAVVAAINPKNTECMFYFHDTKGRFYCSVTYSEHVTKLKEVYGRGK